MGGLDTSVSNHVCPEGWHVPAKDEWNVLFEKMGGDDEFVALQLKSSDFWGNGVFVGEDNCGFRGMASGGLGENISYTDLFASAFFATNSSAYDNSYEAVEINRSYSFYNSWFKLSIRCVKDK